MKIGRETMGARIKVYSVDGREIYNGVLKSEELSIGSILPSSGGVYIYTLEKAGERIGSGKLVRE